MEQKNNSKQILLSVLGIVILVIVVLGISFAFFSYTKTGSSNNVVQTGEVSLAFTESATISLTNQFPTLDSAAVISGSNNDVTAMNFSVTGYYSASTGTIDYTIYAINGDTVNNRTNRLQDSEINIKLTPSSGTTLVNNYAGPTTSSGNANPVAVSSLSTDANGKILAVGRINHGTISANPQIDSYSLIMYVNDTVRISDNQLTVKFTGAHTETSATKYCASQRVFTNGAYVSGCKIGASGIIADNVEGTTLPVYSTLYYSLKIKVVSTK